MSDFSWAEVITIVIAIVTGISAMIKHFDARMDEMESSKKLDQYRLEMLEKENVKIENELRILYDRSKARHEFILRDTETKIAELRRQYYSVANFLASQGYKVRNGESDSH